MWDFSCSPSRRPEVFTQADLFCFGAELCFFLILLIFLPSPFILLLTERSGKAEQGCEKQTQALRPGPTPRPSTCPKAQLSLPSPPRAALPTPWCWGSPRKRGENAEAQEERTNLPVPGDPQRPRAPGRSRVAGPRRSGTCCSIIACCCCRSAWSWGGDRICCICCGVIICGDIMATDTGTCGGEGHVSTPSPDPGTPSPNTSQPAGSPGASPASLSPRHLWASLWPSAPPGMLRPSLGTW